ncbi:hypothetical protein BGZ82_010932 [Podila clonocystis]|nr:hypothetical protein BGZ82_010932 [Podila clonocystis]
MSSESPSYQDSDDAYTRIIHFLETSLAFIPGVSDAEQETTLEAKLRTIQRAMQDHERKQQDIRSHMSKDIMRLRAERNRAIDNAKRFKADRTVLQAKVESLMSVNNTIQADLVGNLKSSQTPPPQLPSPSSSDLAYSDLSFNPYSEAVEKVIAETTAALKDFKAQLGASRHDQDHLHKQVIITTEERNAAKQERDDLTIKYQESEKRVQGLADELALTRSDQARLREQLEAASHGRDAMSVRYTEAKAQADAAAKELAWVKSVQEQLDTELKAAKQEQERLAGQVQECGRRTSVDTIALTRLKAEKNNTEEQLERKEKAVLSLHQQLQSMGQILEEKGAHISEMNEMLEKKGREVETLGQSLAKRARASGETRDSAVRNDEDWKRLKQGIEEQQRRTEKQQREIERLNAMVAHHARVAMTQKYEVSVGEKEIQKLKGEIEEMKAWQKDAA